MIVYIELDVMMRRGGILTTKLYFCILFY